MIKTFREDPEICISCLWGGKDKNGMKESFKFNNPVTSSLFYFAACSWLTCSRGVTQREYFYWQKPAAMTALPRRASLILFSRQTSICSSSLSPPSAFLPTPHPSLIFPLRSRPLQNSREINHGGCHGDGTTRAGSVWRCFCARCTVDCSRRRRCRPRATAQWRRP